MRDDPPPRRLLHDSPVDLDGQSLIGGRPLLWAATTIATAALLLLLTNAIALDGWAAELPPSERVARLNAATGHWRETTDRAGLGATRAGMHAVWKRWQAARFAGQPAAR